MGITRRFNSDKPPRCLFCVAIPLRFIITQNKQRSSLPVKPGVRFAGQARRGGKQKTVYMTSIVAYSESMSKHTVQRIFQQYLTPGPKISLPLHHLKVLDKLSTCRTAVLGGHAQYSENNHLNGIWYNSCKHRACPQCRSMPTEEWLINTQRVLLDCPHHHVIFTIPSALNDLWRYNQHIMTDILFKATQETLKQFSKDPQYLNATPGILCALHTRGRNLSLHPHIHVLLSHGGINEKGEWMTPKKENLFPQKPVMIVYRAKLLALIKNAMKKEKDWQPPPDSRENRITSLLNKLGRQPWVMHFCKRYEHAEGVAKYLSRYVKSGPLKNKQIKSVTAEQVKYQYYSHQNKKTEILTLPTGQFIQRLLQHAPLPGKPTVRYSGLYHAATRKKLNLARGPHWGKPKSARVKSSTGNSFWKAEAAYWSVSNVV